MDITTLLRARWRHASAALLIALPAASAIAQWQWIDSTGSRVFSDTPPPASIPDKSILKRPGVERSRAPVAAETSPPTATTTVGSTSTNPGTDKELEARKKAAEQAEEAKRKAEQEKLAKARAENCERAKRAKATMDSGVRIVTTNAKGEREIMDDKARAAESQRLDNIIRSDCGPLPAQAVAQ